MSSEPTIPPEAIKAAAKAAYEAMHDPSGMTYVDTDTDDYSSVAIDGCVDLAHVTEAAIAAAMPHLVGWRPIDTAPKDGTKVLLWWPHWSEIPMVGECRYQKWRANDAIEDSSTTIGPTHWQPLPPPPAGSEG
jgi:hypothetical protein